MSDDIDRAQTEIDFFLANAMKNRPAHLQPNGACLFCELELIGIEGDYPKLFCNSDCRDDFEHQKKLEKIRGK
jgi:hypothetical protein